MCKSFRSAPTFAHRSADYIRSCVKAFSLPQKPSTHLRISKIPSGKQAFRGNFANPRFVICHFMTTEQYDIKTNINIGQEIFENIPNDIRPGWAGLVLSRFDHYIKNIPTSISELYPIIDDIDRWKEAHEQFTKI